MKFTIISASTAPFIFALLGCTPVAEISDVKDNVVGYRSTVEITLDDKNSIVEAENLVLQSGGTRIHSEISTTNETSLTRTGALLGSENIKRGSSADVIYSVVYRPAFFLPEKTLTVKQRLSSNRQASFSSISLPSCIHVGDVIDFKVNLSPAPHKDRFKVAVEGGDCLSVNSRGNTQFSLQAECTGNWVVSVDAPKRDLIPDLKLPSIEIKNRLSRPSNLGESLGFYVKLDDGGVFEDAGGTLTSGDYRRVQFSWDAPNYAKSFSLQIFSAGETVPFQQELISGSQRSAKIILPTDESFFWRISANYDECTAFDRSEFAQGLVFENK